MNPVEIPWSLFGDIGLGLLICTLIFTGLLVPLRTVRQWLEVKDQLIAAERKINSVQAESLAQVRKTLDTLTETNRMVVDEYGKTTAYSLQQIQQQAKEVADSND